MKDSTGNKSGLYGGFQKLGWKTPKMDGENNGKPYDQMDDLGYHYFRKHKFLMGCT